MFEDDEESENGDMGEENFDNLEGNDEEEEDDDDVTGYYKYLNLAFK